MRGAGAAQEAAILDDVSPGGARARVSDREPAVQVRELTRSYGSRQVVRDVSFTVPAGGIFCLVGPNGAGKTTTIEILEGLRTPTSGAIDIFGIDAIANRNALKSRIGASASFPAARSGASASPPPSSTTPISCSSTSRPREQTRSPGASSGRS